MVKPRAHLHSSCTIFKSPKPHSSFPSSPQPHNNSPYFTMLSVVLPSRPTLSASTLSPRPATNTSPRPATNSSPRPATNTSPRVKFAPPQAFATASTENYTTTSYLPPYNPHHMATNAAACGSFYEILGIPTGASCQEIKAAYRRLARTSHPDTVLAANQKDSSAGEFMRIHAAYSTLSDPKKRADYDRKLFHRYRPLKATAFASGYRSRNWETDQCW